LAFFSLKQKALVKKTCLSGNGTLPLVAEETDEG